MSPRRAARRRPSRDARPHVPERPGLVVRRAELRRGSGSSARGGSRGSPRTRRSARPTSRSSQSANCTWRGRAKPLRGRLVGGVPDEEVLEAERRLTREARLGGADEVLRREGLEARLHGARARRVDEGSTTAPRWKTSPSIEPRSSVARAPGSSRVEARAEERVEARRQGERVEVALKGADAVLEEQGALVHEHRDELLDEERVASRRSREPRAQRRGCALRAGRRAAVDLVLAERLEPHRDVPVGTRARGAPAGRGRAP